MTPNPLDITLDAIQTGGILVICGVLIYFVIRLEQNIRTVAELMRAITTTQKDIQRRLDRIEVERFPEPRS